MQTINDLIEHAPHALPLDRATLRTWLREHGITQREAAAWAGIHERSFRRALNGTGNIPIPMVRASMRALMARAVADGFTTKAG
jgi:hypothetical protein